MIDREKQALDIIKEQLGKHKAPVVMCSFGKDSMVMLYLIRKIRKDIPVLFLKEPFHSKKYEFANSVIAKWNLWTYDYMPSSMDLIYNEGNLEVLGLYHAGALGYFYVPTGISPMKEGDELICAVRDIFHKPQIPAFDYPWDLSFVGHKASDVDPILGQVPVENFSRKNGNTLVVYPIQEWTDKEIWEYTVKNNIPYNTKRYDKDNGFKEFKDHTFNNDYHECCHACLIPDGNNEVYCPVEKKDISNIGKLIDFEKKVSAYKEEVA